MCHVLDALKNIELYFWTRSFMVDIGSTTKQDLVPKSKEHDEKSNSLPRTEDNRQMYKFCPRTPLSLTHMFTHTHTATVLIYNTSYPTEIYKGEIKC